MEKKNSLTAIELIEALQKLPPETVVKIPDYDSEWSFWYNYGVESVGDQGFLRRSSILASGHDYDDIEDDDE